jgi:predicted DNA-binding protein
MSVLRAVTLRLDPEDYERLETEAKRLGLAPATLVRIYVRARLNGGEAELERRSRIGLEALDRLARLTADLPAVDAMEIARESRGDLESRSSL